MGMVNMEETYNGWSNRETWAYALWLGNDQGLYDSMTENIDDIIRHTYPDRDKAISDLEDWLKANLEELKEFSNQIAHKDCKGECVHLMLEDIGSDWRIDYREIAESELTDPWEEYSHDN